MAFSYWTLLSKIIYGRAHSIQLFFNNLEEFVTYGWSKQLVFAIRPNVFKVLSWTPLLAGSNFHNIGPQHIKLLWSPSHLSRSWHQEVTGGGGGWPVASKIWLVCRQWRRFNRRGWKNAVKTVEHKDAEFEFNPPANWEPVISLSFHFTVVSFHWFPVRWRIEFQLARLSKWIGSNLCFRMERPDGR